MRAVLGASGSWSPVMGHRPPLQGLLHLWPTCPPSWPWPLSTHYPAFPLTGFKLRSWHLGTWALTVWHHMVLIGLKSIVCKTFTVFTPTFTHHLLIKSRNRLKIGRLSQQPLLVSSL